MHLGLQACQSREFSHRGVGRYVHDAALWLLESDPSVIGGLHLDKGLPVSQLIKDFAGYGLLRGFRASAPPADPPDGDLDLFHLMSPVDLELSLRTLIPSQFYYGTQPLIATLFDLIPLIYPKIYLADTTTRQRYLARLRVYKEADHVVAISEASRRDGIRLLGLDRDRVSVVYPAVSDSFKPPEISRGHALEEVMARIPTIRSPFVLYVGGIDHRKNLWGAIDAFAALPAKLQEAYQFVIVCHAREADRQEITEYARSKGVGGQILATGFVEEQDLVRLYQACQLFVFPSLYEGFGLPVVEAMKSGAPVIVGDNSSLAELVQIKDARFDASKPAAIARCMEKALTDSSLRTQLTTYGGERSRAFGKENLVDGLLNVYAQVAGRFTGPGGSRAPHLARRIRLAFCTPYPPAESGIAGYSQRVLNSLCARYPVRVDVVVSERPESYEAPPGAPISFVSPDQFRQLNKSGEYDEVIYCMGNSHFHGYIYELLQEIPGIVWLHDPRLTGFYGWYWAQMQKPALPTPPELTPWSERYGPLADSVLTLGLDVLEQNGIYMAGEVASHAKKVIVNSAFAKEVVELESDGAVEVIAILPGELPLPESTTTWPSLAMKYGLDPSTRVILTLGWVAHMKWPEVIADAFAAIYATLPDTSLIFVGDCPSSTRDAIQKKLHTTPAGSAVRFTGYVDEAEVVAWLRSAACAIELRYPATGGSSGAVMRCLAAGIPTIVSNNGPFRELPSDAVYKLPTPPARPDLERAILAILQDESLDGSLRSNASRFAEETSLDLAADRLWQVIVSSAAQSATPQFFVKASPFVGR